MTAPTPYGPATRVIRRFLVQLAAMNATARDAVVARFTALSDSREFAAADAVLGETIERSGRAAERDALAGPLLQLVREHRGVLPADGTAQPDDLDPVAEPALAALMSLLVEDLLSPRHFRALYSAFDESIPRELLDG